MLHHNDVWINTQQDFLYLSLSPKSHPPSSPKKKKSKFSWDWNSSNNFEGWWWSMADTTKQQLARSHYTELYMQEFILLIQHTGFVHILAYLTSPKVAGSFRSIKKPGSDSYFFEMNMKPLGEVSDVKHTVAVNNNHPHRDISNNCLRIFFTFIYIFIMLLF